MSFGLTRCYHHNLAEPEGKPRTRWAQKMNTCNLRIGSCAGVQRAESAMYPVNPKGIVRRCRPGVLGKGVELPHVVEYTMVPMLKVQEFLQLDVE
jgi:hypothetical protein